MVSKRYIDFLTYNVQIVSKRYTDFVDLQCPDGFEKVR